MPDARLTRIKTKGFSMWPFVKPGQELLMMAVPPEQLRVGDIVAYERGDLVCHRLVRAKKVKDGWILYTRGDNQLETETVDASRYKGKIIAICGASCVNDLTAPAARVLGLFLIIILPLFVRLKRLVKPL